MNEIEEEGEREEPEQELRDVGEETTATPDVPVRPTTQQQQLQQQQHQQQQSLGGSAKVQLRASLSSARVCIACKRRSSSSSSTSGVQVFSDGSRTARCRCAASTIRVTGGGGVGKHGKGENGGLAAAAGARVPPKQSQQQSHSHLPRKRKAHSSSSHSTTSTTTTTPSISSSSTVSFSSQLPQQDHGRIAVVDAAAAERKGPDVHHNDSDGGRGDGATTTTTTSPASLALLLATSLRLVHFPPVDQPLSPRAAELLAADGVPVAPAATLPPRPGAAVDPTEEEARLVVHRRSYLERLAASAVTPVMRAAVCALGAFEAGMIGLPYSVFTWYYSFARSQSMVAAIEPTLEGLQTWLILGYASLLLGKSSVSRLQFGMACRMAVLLKLDVDPDDLDGDMSVVEKEVRRRCWWTCYLADRLSAAAAGRPAVIPAISKSVKSPCAESLWLSLDSSAVPMLASLSPQRHTMAFIPVFEMHSHVMTIAWRLPLLTPPSALTETCLHIKELHK
ncbi:hypothetical protein DFJ73DRAFT_962684, partial [Zopfochytrium polystomum]